MKPESELRPIRVGNRAFVFGGAYGNFQAAQAMLAQAASLGFSPHQIIFTGDVVAYCGQPQETAELIGNSGIHVIMGNCEEALGQNAENCGCGFEEGSACNLLSVEWYRFCQSQLDDETKLWMSSLPKSLVFELNEHLLQCFHGTQNAINEFVFPSDIRNRNFSIHSDLAQIDGYIVGHSGLPFLATVNEKAWINSGAAGMPANDGTPRVWYATLESHDSRLHGETHPLKYDYVAAAAAMEEAGLTNGYRECLTTGIWPSHDVLPEMEREHTGQPISPERIVLSKLKNEISADASA